jgi:hypothetical protein
MESSNSNSNQLGGCLVRLLWMAVGNLVLVLLAIGIFQNRAGFALTSLDLFYWVTAFGLLALRYVDIRFLNGKTGDNQPATMNHWVRYAAVVLGISFVMWAIVHLVSIS